MDNTKFVSKENIDNLYKFICSKVTIVKLDEDKNSKKIVKKLIKKIYETHLDNNYNQLNRIAVEQIIPFMNKRANEKKQRESENVNTPVIPEKESPGKEKQQNFSFAEQLKKKNEERSYDRFLNDTNSFREQVELANEEQKKNLDEINQKKTGKPFFEDMGTQDEFALAYNSSSVDLFNFAQNDSQSSVPQIANDITIKVLDQSNGNEVSSYDPSLKPTDLIEESFGTDNKLSVPTLYQNTRTGSERIMNSILVIDTGKYDASLTPKESLNSVDGEGNETVLVKNLGTNPWYNFKVNFGSSFNVDKVSDIFLKRFTIVGPASPQHCQYFVINMSELTNNSSSNNINMKNRFIVPNTVNQTITRTALNFTGDQAKSTGSVTVNVNADPTSIIFPRDDIFADNVFVGTATAVAANSITFGEGVKAAISNNSKITIATVDQILNTGAGEDNFIATVNPKVMKTITFRMTNQDGNHTDSTIANNNTFAVADSVRNRVVIELEFRARELNRTIDFVKAEI